MAHKVRTPESVTQYAKKHGLFVLTTQDKRDFYAICGKDEEDRVMVCGVSGPKASAEIAGNESIERAIEAMATSTEADVVDRDENPAGRNIKEVK